MSLQKTTRAPFELEGACLWDKGVSRVRVSPADPDTGIVLRRIDTGKKTIFPISVENAEVESHRVVLSSSGTKLGFVEHLLAALWGMGIDNVNVEVKGAELPFLDGSALPYVKEINRVGTLTQVRNRRFFRPRHSLWMLNRGRCMYFAPASDFSIGYIFWHNSPRICRFPSIEHDFVIQVAPARTFATTGYPSFHYPFKIRHSGKLSFPYPGRFADEMLRHKVLDIVGDFALMGVRVKAHVWAYGTGHSDTHKAIKLLLKEEKRWKTSA